jgi:small-conductance mechanosensitive channel
MGNLAELIQKTTDLNPELQTKLMTSVVIVLLLWLIRTLIIRIIWRRTEDVRVRYIWRKTLTYIMVGLSIILVSRVWFKGIQSVATFLGLVSAGVAIALKDMITNIAGWVFILARRPFTLGDRVQIGEDAGDVIDISVFQFTLLETGNWVDADQSTGRIIHIPNGKVFNETLANYSKGFQYIWNEIPVLVTFESNWEKAKSILQHIAYTHAEHLSKSAEKRIKEASKKFMIFYTVLTPTVYTSVKECGVLLTIRYLCEPRSRRGSEQDILEDILKEFAKNTDIDFAYPTQRFFNNKLEGKTGTKVSSLKDDIKEL